ncbi:MAG: 50S ribosomal protein P1 [Candidatus Aenigmarchaeota archaeon]|nr:50S ribosomal protein P1 [Candidatus Aenigmarchaeota archaeon]
MEMIYAAMLLHSVKQPINEDNLKKVLHSVGAQVEEAKIKGVVASLEGINIEEAISKAAMPVAAASAPVAEKKEEKKEEDTAKKAEEAAAGLGALFG